MFCLIWNFFYFELTRIDLIMFYISIPSFYLWNKFCKFVIFTLIKKARNCAPLIHYTNVITWREARGSVVRSVHPVYLVFADSLLMWICPVQHTLWWRLYMVERLCGLFVRGGSELQQQNFTLLYVVKQQ